MGRVFENEEYNSVYLEDLRLESNHGGYAGHWLENDDLSLARKDGLVWYNISDPIPMTEQDIFECQQGLNGVYYHWTPENFPKYWIVRRGQYHIKPEWDYMDVIAVNEDMTKHMWSTVVRMTDKGVITERKFNNLVDKLSNPDHDMLKVKKSYF